MTKTAFILLTLLFSTFLFASDNNQADSLSGKTFETVFYGPMMQRNGIDFLTQSDFKWEQVGGDYYARKGTYSIGSDRSGVYLDIKYKEDFGGTPLDEQQWTRAEWYISLTEGILFFYKKSDPAIIEEFFTSQGYRIVEYQAKASSEFKETIKGKTIVYSAQYLAGFSLKKFWAENAGTDGTGEYIQFTFKRPDFDEVYGEAASFDVKACVFFNGTAYPADLFKKNNRVKSADLEFDTGHKITLSVKDTPDPQLFLLQIPSEVKTARLTIKSVYKGTHWDDLCITKVYFLE